MRVENSPEYEAKMKKRHEAWKREARKSKRIRDEARQKAWAAGVPWQPIEECPFAAFAETSGVEGSLLVTDGTKIARVSLRKRFGTPQVWVGEGEPEEIWRDGMLHIEGKGEWKEPDWPDWLKKWEFTDEDGLMTYAGGEETGKEEIDFIPTHWLPMPT